LEGVKPLSNVQRIHALFIDIIRRFAVTIIIEIYLNQSLRILAQSGQHAEDYGLLLKSGCSHFKNGNEDLMQENFDFFLQMTLINITANGFSLLTLSFVRMPAMTLQNISTLISNTCGTGLTAFRLRLKHRYWLMA
jgi:hypothetical protein